VSSCLDETSVCLGFCSKLQSVWVSVQSFSLSGLLFKASVCLCFCSKFYLLWCLFNLPSIHPRFTPEDVQPLYKFHRWNVIKYREISFSQSFLLLLPPKKSKFHNHNSGQIFQPSRQLISMSPNYVNFETHMRRKLPRSLREKAHFAREKKLHMVFSIYPFYNFSDKHSHRRSKQSRV
jgi:hypothetical protein